MSKTKTERRSCYVLELSVDPGGARRGCRFTYRSLEHVFFCLREEFLSRHKERTLFAAYLALLYGEDITLRAIDQGALVHALDLHPFLTARLGKKETLRLDDGPALARLRRQVEEVAGDDGGFESGLRALGFRGFEVDWKGIEAAIPALHAPSLMPGESMTFVVPARLTRNKKTRRDEVVYGYSSDEGWNYPYDKDPDPPRATGASRNDPALAALIVLRAPGSTARDQERARAKLIKLGEASVSAISEALDGAEPWLASRLLPVLGELGATDAMAALVRAKSSPAVLCVMAGQLGRVPSGEAAAVLGELLSSRVDAVAQAAASALGEMGRPALPTLAAALGSKNQFLRRRAAAR